MPIRVAALRFAQSEASELLSRLFECQRCPRARRHALSGMSLAPSSRFPIRQRTFQLPLLETCAIIKNVSRRGPAQKELPFAKGWGGAREGAGRKPGLLRRDPHKVRPKFKKALPTHVTIRLGVKNTRNENVHAAVRLALAGLKDARSDFRVTDYVLEDGHLHFSVEGDSAAAFDSGMRALSIRLAKRINAALKRRGKLFDDRHHRRQLSTPTETRNCLAYIVMNHRKHAAEKNWNVSKTGEIDRYSSGEWFDGWTRSPKPSESEPVVHAPKTWLRTTGWRLRGLIDPASIPGRGPRSSSFKPTKKALADLHRWQ